MCVYIYYDLKSTQTSCDINSWPLAVQAQAITHTDNIILFVGTCINYLATKAFIGNLSATGSGWVIIKINGSQLLTTLIGVHSTMHLMHPNQYHVATTNMYDCYKDNNNIIATIIIMSLISLLNQDMQGDSDCFAAAY